MFQSDNSQKNGRGVHADNKEPDMQKADNHALMYTDLSGATRLAGKQARKCTDFYLPKELRLNTQTCYAVYRVRGTKL